MNKRLGRYCKRVIALFCSFVVFFVGFYLTSFQSNAAAVELTVDYAEPAKSESQGYVNILLYNQVGGYSVKTFFWSCYATVNGVQSPAEMHIKVTNEHTIEFVPWGIGADSAWYSIGMIDGNTGLYYEMISTATEHYSYTFAEVVRGYTIHGNGYLDEFSAGMVSFSVNFSTDDSDVLLQRILDTLNSSDNVSRDMQYYIRNISSVVYYIMQNTDGVENQLLSVIDYLKSVDSELDSIKSELQAIYDKADEILEEEEKQTTWLEKIWTSIQEFLGMQGEESTEPLPDEEVGSVLEEEDKLMQDTTEAENSLDFSVDSNSNNVVWNIIERVLNANSRVFGAFIGIMTLGVITLLLNR